MKTNYTFGTLALLACAGMSAPAPVESAANPSPPTAPSRPTAPVRVAGQFKAHEAVAFAPGISLADIIVKARGFTDRADKGAVKVTRINLDGTLTKLTVDCRSDAATKAFLLQAGDIVYAPDQTKR